MWVEFKTGFVEALERFIPSIMTKTKYHGSIYDQTACKKRHKLYLCAPKSKDPQIKIHYKRFRAHIQKVLRDAYWKHVFNIFTVKSDSSDADTFKLEKIKKFWSFVKSLKKAAFGITSLRENGILKTDSKEKKPTFVIGNSIQPDSDLPSKGASPFCSMGDITVDPPKRGRQTVGRTKCS